MKKDKSVKKDEQMLAFDSTLQKADRMKLNYQLSVINSKIDRLKKKQSMLRTNVAVEKPKR